VSDRERRGCFLINSAFEVAPHDRELRCFVADCFAEIEVSSIDPSRRCEPKERSIEIAPPKYSGDCWSRTKGWRQADHGVRIARDLSAFDGFAGKALGYPVWCADCQRWTGTPFADKVAHHHLLLTAH
jgi:hypothetical protein